MEGIVFLNEKKDGCESLQYIDANLTVYVYSQLGDRCVTPSIVVPTIVIYGLILALGFFGNLCTCLVIIRNKSMQNATNYYLFSLAVSDLLMLVLGLPMELYGVFDVLYPYRFGEFICKLRAFLIEFTSYASILTIACFSIERWLAICFPLRVKTFSSLDRAVKVIIAVWICAFIAALPVAFIVVLNRLPLPLFILQQPSLISKVSSDNLTIAGTDYCAMDFNRPIAQKNFIFAAFFVFFLFPALLITFVYCHIVLRLTSANSAPHLSASMTGDAVAQYEKQKMQNRKSLLKVLCSVVIMFFLCWLPFHVQRLLTIFLNEMNGASSTTKAFHSVFNLVFYISGYCFYSNSACNPILYNILSEKYRLAFCKTILGHRLTDKIWAKRSSFRQQYTCQISQVMHRCSECSVDRTHRSIYQQSNYESVSSFSNVRRKSTGLPCSSKNLLQSHQCLAFSSKNSLSLNYPRRSFSHNTCNCSCLKVHHHQQQQCECSNSLKNCRQNIRTKDKISVKSGNRHTPKFKTVDVPKRQISASISRSHREKSKFQAAHRRTWYHRLKSSLSLPLIETPISENFRSSLSSLSTSFSITSPAKIPSGNSPQNRCSKKQTLSTNRQHPFNDQELPSAVTTLCGDGYSTNKLTADSRAFSYQNGFSASPLLEYKKLPPRRHSMKLSPMKKYLVLGHSRMALFSI